MNTLRISCSCCLLRLAFSVLPTINLPHFYALAPFSRDPSWRHTASQHSWSVALLELRSWHYSSVVRRRISPFPKRPNLLTPRKTQSVPSLRFRYSIAQACQGASPNSKSGMPYLWHLFRCVVRIHSSISISFFQLPSPPSYTPTFLRISSKSSFMPDHVRDQVHTAYISGFFIWSFVKIISEAANTQFRSVGLVG